MKNYTINLILVAAALLFSSALSANSLCQNSSCEIDFSFDEGGSISTTGYLALRFGNGGFLNLGDGGQITLGESGSLVGITPELLQAGGVIEAGVEILVSSDGAIDFGAGASVVLGSGGNIDYPVGDNVSIDGASIININSTEAEEVVSIQSIDTAGVANLFIDHDIYLGDFDEPTGINITSPSDTSEINVQSWDIKLVQMTGIAQITGSSNVNNVYIANGSSETTPGTNWSIFPQECTDSNSNATISGGTPVDSIDCADATITLQNGTIGGEILLDSSLSVTDTGTVISVDISPQNEETANDSTSNNGGGGAISLLLLALGLTRIVRKSPAMKDPS